MDVISYHAVRLPVDPYGDVAVPELCDRATVALSLVDIDQAAADGEAAIAALRQIARGADPARRPRAPTPPAYRAD